MKLPTVAICYDFDSTLAPDNMQEHGFFDAIGKTPDEFWGESNAIVKKNRADNILVNMYRMIHDSRKNNISLTRQKLGEFGSMVKFFSGVETWFQRINEYGKNIGVNVEHYIVSSGIKEMIEGMSIAKYFKKIYACSYIYDSKGNAVWPALSINYTNKTQYLYRINKGCLDETDDSINEIMDHDSRYVPFENMIYIGDSFTDIPCMRLVMKNGGKTIGVYDPNKGKMEKVKTLITNNKINYIAPADYSKGKTLEIIVKEIIKSCKINHNLKLLSKAQKK